MPLLTSNIKRGFVEAKVSYREHALTYSQPVIRHVTLAYINRFSTQRENKSNMSKKSQFIILLETSKSFVSSDMGGKIWHQKFHITTK